MTEQDIKIWHTYAAKRPRTTRIPGEGEFYTDRQVISFDGRFVQYDSIAVKPGRSYPKISVEKFLEWAAEDITDQMPKGKWRKVSP